MWRPQHRLLGGETIPQTGSVRVSHEDAASPEFQQYLKQRTKPSIIAEGDSRFYLPRPGISDLIEALEDISTFNHEILAFATHGHTLDMMAYGYVDEFGRPHPPGMDEVVAAAKTIQPKALLLSAGGNDFVGAEFKMLLNHKASNRPGLRLDVVNYIIHEYIKKTYLECAARLWAVSSNTKVFLHGYADSWPTGKKYLWFGPWLWPSLQEKMFDRTQGRQIVIQVIDEFNKMLQAVAATNAKLVRVDFRPYVGSAITEWYDELHLTEDALQVAGAVYSDAIIKAIGN
jgi:hypothetical protein